MPELDDDAARLISSLVALRHRLNVTQVELAARSGLTQQAISRLERKSSGHVSTLVSYARGLGVQLVLRAPDDFDEQLAVYDERDARRAERFETIAERMIRTHD